MSNGNERLVIGLIIVFAIFIVMAMPLVTIWSLNTLFSLEIPYNVSTWMAVMWLITLLHVARSKIKRND